MSYVVIVKTGKDKKLWKHMPDDHPVLCEEFDTIEQATEAHPGKQVLTIAEYKDHADHYHSNYPAPRPQRKWWHWLMFWRTF